MRQGVIPRIDRNQFIVAYMTSVHSPEAVERNPPKLMNDVADAQDRAVELLTLRSNSRYWDIYNKIIQLSFYCDDAFQHFVLCDNPLDVHKIKSSRGKLLMFATEQDLIKAALDYLWTLYGAENSEGTTLLHRYLAGWKMHQHIWPSIVRRAFKYRLRVPRCLLTDPEKKWPTIYRLIDVGAIYNQSAGSTSVKNQPTLLDLLTYWGFASGTEALPAWISETVCESPEEATTAVEPYLKGMLDALEQYYKSYEDDTVENGKVNITMPQFAIPSFDELNSTISQR